MSDRERWVVYPLLFLAIGLAFRNNLELQDALHGTHATELDVRCNALEVVAADGKPRVSLGTGTNGEGFLKFVAADGKLLAQLCSAESGSLLSLFDRHGQSMLRIGYEDNRAELVVSNPLTGQVHPLFTAPVLPMNLSPIRQEKSDRGPASQPESKPDGTSSQQE